MTGTLNRAVRVLRWVAPGTALTSMTLVAIAMTTPAWLATNERFPNGTGQVINKRTYSGLWEICFTPLGSNEFVCQLIDYFPRERYSPDATDSTMAIPNAVVTTGPFLFAGAAVLLAAEICYAVGHCFRRRRLLSFVGGVNFILAGLLAMIATIVYISTFKAEVKNKLRARNIWDPPRLTYRFGYSFYSLVAGFIMSELTGIVVVFLYIFWHQRDWERKNLKLAQQGCLLNGCTPRLTRDTPTSRSLDGGPPAERWQQRGIPDRQFASLPRRLEYRVCNGLGLGASFNAEWTMKEPETGIEYCPRVKRQVEEWPRMRREPDEWPRARPEVLKEWGEKWASLQEREPPLRPRDAAEWGERCGPGIRLPPRSRDHRAEWPPPAASQRRAPACPPAAVYSLRVEEGAAQPRLVHPPATACRCHRPAHQPPAAACYHVCRHQRRLPPTCVRCSALLSRQPAPAVGWPGGARPPMPAPHLSTFREVTPI